MLNIVKYQALKNGNYEIFLDNNSSIILDDHLILKEELLEKKKIDEKDIPYLLKQNNIYELYNRALKRLALGFTSSFKMEELLLKYAPKEEVEEVIKKLQEENKLNDEVYAQKYIKDKLLLSKDGPYKIKMLLEKEKIKEEYIDKALLLYKKELEEEKIKKIIATLLKINKTKSVSQMKEYLKAYLYSHGFKSTTYLPLIKEVSFDDTKQKEKLLEKLKRNNIDEITIKKKLYQKGFND